MKNVIIIGAGPAGLAAGYELLKQSKDYNVTILEATNEIGGLARTVKYKNFYMDLGGHHYFSKEKRVMDWWEEIMPLQGEPAFDDARCMRFVPTKEGGPDPAYKNDVLLVRDRVAQVYRDGKYYDYPITMNMSTLRNMGIGSTLKAGISFVGSSVARRKENSLENFYINKYGKQIYSMFFENYTQKLWGRHPNEIDGSWGAQKLKGLTVTSEDKDSSKKNGKKTSGYENPYYYPKYGSGQMWECVAAKIEEMGGKIHKNCKVVKVNTEGSRVTSLVGVIDGESIEVYGDEFISTMPMKDMVCGMNNVPENIKGIAEKLPYRELVYVGIQVPSLNIKKPPHSKSLGELTPDTWICIQDADIKMSKLQIYNNWSPYMLEKPDKSVWIGAEYFCNEGDRFWEMSEDEWINLAVKELVQLRIISASTPILEGHKERSKNACPAYFGSYEKIGDVVDYVNQFKNLYCVGRNGQHKYNNMGHSIMTAFEAVHNIINHVTDKTNLWNVRNEQEIQDEKKPEEVAKEEEVRQTSSPVPPVRSMQSASPVPPARPMQTSSPVPPARPMQTASPVPPVRSVRNASPVPPAPSVPVQDIPVAEVKAEPVEVKEETISMVSVEPVEKKEETVSMVSAEPAEVKEETGSTVPVETADEVAIKDTENKEEPNEVSSEAYVEPSVEPSVELPVVEKDTEESIKTTEEVPAEPSKSYRFRPTTHIPECEFEEQYTRIHNNDEIQNRVSVLDLHPVAQMSNEEEQYESLGASSTMFSVVSCFPEEEIPGADKNAETVEVTITEEIAEDLAEESVIEEDVTEEVASEEVVSEEVASEEVASEEVASEEVVTEELAEELVVGAESIPLKDEAVGKVVEFPTVKPAVQEVPASPRRLLRRYPVSQPVKTEEPVKQEEEKEIHPLLRGIKPANEVTQTLIVKKEKSSSPIPTAEEVGGDGNISASPSVMTAEEIAKNAPVESTPLFTDKMSAVRQSERVLNTAGEVEATPESITVDEVAAEYKEPVNFARSPIEEMMSAMQQRGDIPEEEPVAEETAEEPVVEEAAEEPVIEEVAEEPVAEETVEEPVAEETVEEPAIEEVAEEPVAEETVEEPVIEEVAEEPVAEEV
ncbi:MAG: FAD-dependent oxidoreductase, partial [Lachnospiraceae bacterium]|nr:FAD-dependent oxidoreductase [Lachnospiraceae bacterium]